ncbi:PhzF family phenazine biosynthesis protein [Microvirga sp. BSC39]|uniref:PhzF family phenazine biosynthesis protein n=1 Tax=Microvirga sp. BSC39 TaxID=1549810 RepID=UPI0004E897D2|nr:PhzF family phenazine biosynthesis protein [Microvirga sp. BSC39]KFG66533.1 phenazine biosynthesis protein PhzF [Microvirga sp. BSC39]
MPRFPYETVDVFTDRAFGGNPLAVFTDARGLSDTQMQALAAEMNYSETTFVLPSADPANDACVRIFHRTAEMPFAGHPNVGTAFVLACHGRDRDGVLRFEQKAGLVEITVERDAAGAVTGAVIAAPQALSLGMELPIDEIATCVGLSRDDIATSAHKPVHASVGVKFVLMQIRPDALARATPDLAAFRKLVRLHGELAGRLSLFLYARDGDTIRARMFAPLAGTWEDPATGSASAALGALLLSLDGGDKAAFSIIQGVEIGRPSALKVMSWRAEDGYRSRVGGSCTPMFRGEALL